MGMGTDVAPHNLVEEMRLAIILARVMPGNINAVDTAEIFRAATVGGAAALGRDDLGRLVPEAKADVVLIDLDHPAMRPVRDPLRTFVFEAADRAVREVFVDGEAVARRREAPASRSRRSCRPTRGIPGPNAGRSAGTRLPRKKRGSDRAALAAFLSEAPSGASHPPRAVLFTAEPAPGPRPRVRSLGPALHGMACRGGDPVPRRWRPRAAPARMG